MDAKEKIKNGALKMFTTFGIRNITMDMIADELGISKRTIYENFKDKDELVKCCIELAITEHKRIKEEIQSKSSNIIELMILILKNGISIMKSVNPLFFHDLKKHYSTISQQTVEYNDKKNIDQLAEYLKIGIKEKLFRSNINVEIVAILFFEQLRILNEKNAFPEDKFSKVEVFENIVINFLRGISTEQGLSMIDMYNV